MLRTHGIMIPANYTGFFHHLDNPDNYNSIFIVPSFHFHAEVCPDMGCSGGGCQPITDLRISINGSVPQKLEHFRGPYLEGVYEELKYTKGGYSYSWPLCGSDEHIMICGHVSTEHGVTLICSLHPSVEIPHEMIL